MTNKRFEQVGGDFGDPILYGATFHDAANGTYHFWMPEEDGDMGRSYWTSDTSPDDFNWVDWDALASFIDGDPKASPATMLEAIIGYYGPDELDSYPVNRTFTEARAFYL